MTHGRVNRLFLMLNGVSLGCAVSDLLLEILSRQTPMTRVSIVLANFFCYTYLLLRNSSLVVYCVFVFASTRTDHRIHSWRKRVLLWLPETVLVILLIQNLFTHNVFKIGVYTGYRRGPWMTGLYVIALFYGLFGAVACIRRKKFMPVDKWIALQGIYLLTFVAVIVQMLDRTMLVEMYSTAVSLLAVLLVIMRPDENMDVTVGLQSWKAYQADLRNSILAGQKVQIAIIQLTNAQEVRTYFGDDLYGPFIEEIAREIRELYRREHVRQEMYFERPGTIYLILDDAGYEVSKLVPTFLRETRERTRIFADLGVQFDPKICLIRYPDDLREMNDIINLGHRFTKMGAPEQVLFKASDITSASNFEIENHMEQILNRAIVEHNIEVYYQPIYDVRTGRFRSAEALARLRDSQYGMISPGIFIPAAEMLGLITPIGNEVLEQVHQFISRHNMEELGLSYVEVNLSVAQCMQRSLLETLSLLQRKYDVEPRRINLEITETTFDTVGEQARKNLNKLAELGYTFALDDYGTGYSNIQRLCRLPLKLIKIDKSMVDEMDTENGRMILRHTVQMMQSINKRLVVEGAETQEAVDALKDMGCDYIQGFYYSRPLPAEDFVKFLMEHNGGGDQGKTP